ncbi:MAG TPA: 16S rRNA (cytosine(967)-C(5))-methyltransferase RsmB [Rhodanobacteraceae bacterium]|jgi:16S rRNA (cytosine967-C5)-methyltransferase|nr:16S rRNA (cytosine(967)-C(5))-methyltransferase RsmB [Rhodanobacteraceae bacterium]
MTDTRALAAEVLADVALHGMSLRERLQPAQAKLPDARDRAFLTALANEGARWWLRFDRALDGLLQQPLRKRESTLHALLVLGLVQLEILQLPPHAAVAATVEATRAIGRGGFAKLANAVLRRWLREREAINAQLDRNAETRSAHPRWLIDALTRDWPEQVGAILAANNQPSPPMLRVNARRTTRERMLAALAQAGVEAQPHGFLRDGITLAANTDVTRLPGFDDGHFSVQDGAAQCAADLMDLRDGLRVLDACAAPGGKACHVLERCDVQLVALDADARRAGAIRANFDRLGLHGEVRSGDAGEPSRCWDGQPFDRILLDAPCSATGVIRRHPDIKLHRRAGDVAQLAREQSRLLAALWPLLARGGRLVYATCSVLREENERVVDAFLDARADARPAPWDWPIGHASGAGRQILPGEGGLDGMHYAVLEKR